MCMIAAQRSIVKWQARSHVLTPPSLLPIFKHKAFSHLPTRINWVGA